MDILLCEFPAHLSVSGVKVLRLLRQLASEGIDAVPIEMRARWWRSAEAQRSSEHAEKQRLKSGKVLMGGACISVLRSPTRAESVGIIQSSLTRRGRVAATEPSLERLG